MSDITPQRKMIQNEETTFRAAVAESLSYRLGAAVNFINKRQYDTLKIPLDGSYWVVTTPQLGVEALDPFPFDVEIFDIAMYSMVAGSGGTTELDVKFATASGGSFNSIFSTTPKIASSAGNNAYFLKSLGVGSGMTAPVFNNTYVDPDTGFINLDAGSAIRVDLLASQSGTPENCGIIIYFRPR